MTRINKILINRKIILSIFVLAVVFGFAFGSPKNALATVTCNYNLTTYGFGEFQSGTPIITQESQEVADAAACTALCTGDKSGCKPSSTDTEKAAAKKALQDESGADPLSGRVTNGGGSSILNSILDLMSYLMSAAMALLIWVLDVENINQTIGNKIVYKIWAQVRDVMNVAFILVLLFSAFCTIFQVDKFNYKKILLTLVIMALLVNFSFPIARVIIDASNIIMYYFAKLAGFKASGNGGNMTEIVKNSQIGELIGEAIKSPKDSYKIAAIIFSFIYAVTMLVIAVLFVVRLAVLTFLVMFSSVAFVGSIVPFLSTQAKKWWDALFKYAFYGPIMIFMLYISTKILSQMSTIGKNMKTVAASQAQSTDLSLVSSIALFAIPITVLWVGLGVAQSMNIALASEVAGRGQKFIGWAGRSLTTRPAAWTGRTAKQVGGFGARWAERKFLMPIGLSPRAIKQGWKERSEEVDKRALSVASGKTRDFFHKMVDGTETNFGQLATDRIKTEEMKRFKEHSDDFQVLGPEMAKLIGSGDANAAEKLCGIFRNAYGNRDQDEIIAYIRENWEKNILGNGKTFKEIFEEDGMSFDDVIVGGWEVDRAVEIMLKNTGKDQKYINKELSDLGQVSAANGSVGHGATKRDKQTGELIRTSREEQAFIAARKHQTVFEPQDRVKKEHRNWETNEYNFDKVNLDAIEKMRWMGVQELTQIERTGTSKQEQVGTNIQLMNSFYRELATMRDGTLKIWNPKIGAVDEIKNVQKNHESQAYINAAQRVALQKLSGVDSDTIIGQLETHGFKVEEVNKILVQGKRDKDVLKRSSDSSDTSAAPADASEDKTIKIVGSSGGGAREKVTFDDSGKPKA